MSTFSIYAIKLLEEYKEILRSFSSLKEANAKIHRLGIANKEMLCANDLTLYKTSCKCLNDFKLFMSKVDTTSTCYQKLDRYLCSLQNFLKNHQIKENRIINLAQETSRLFLEVVQLRRLQIKNDDPSIGKRIEDAMNKICEYGSYEEYEKLKDMLNE